MILRKYDYGKFFKKVWRGCAVKTLDEIPASFAGITIPETKYLVYKSVGGLPDSGLKVWEHIWQSEIDRKYVSDFDLCIQSQNGTQVNTYVSVNQ